MNPGERFGQYDIVGPLGAGGMGVVYRARDTKLGREVALKMLPKVSAADPVRLQRFEQEAQAASALNHPNLVVVYDAGQHDGTPFLVSELLEGLTLRERIDEGPLPPRKAIEIAVQLAAGLSAVHEKGIVHRDLKPENVFLTRDGRVKILDFGVARAMEELPRATNTLPLTQTGAVMGTAGYMSPEQVRGRPADPRSDLFSLGAVLYEMLTGSMAFPGETPVERGYAILNHDPPGFEEAGVSVAPALDRVVRRCLEKEPEQRFQHARDLAFALEAITHDSGRHLPLAPARKTPWRRVGLVVAGAALLALGSLIGQHEAAAPPPPAVLPPGPARPAITRVSFRNGTIFAARFTAADKGLVYSGAFEGGPPQVVSGQLGSAQTRPVAASWSTLLDASPDDELAIATLDKKKGDQKGAVLSRVALAGGTPRAMLENVVSADFSPDGQQLLTVRAGSNSWTLEFPPGHVLVESKELIRSARFSPSGDRVAFTRHPVPFDDRGRVEVVDLSGKLLVRSSDYWTLDGLAWPPGGDEVWFTAANRNLQRSIRALSSSGNEREVFATPGTLRIHDVDAKGRALVGTSIQRSRIFGKVAGDERERPLSWFDGSEPAALSWDGKQMLFIEGAGADSQEIETYLRVFDDGPAPIRLSSGWGRALSPDGKWALISPAPPFTSLALVPTGPGDPIALPKGDFTAILCASFFPDGKQLLISARGPDGKPHVYVQPLPATGANPGLERPSSPPERVADDELRSMAPPSPDGKKVVAITEERAVVMLDLESGQKAPLRGLPPENYPQQWTEDGKGLIVTRPNEGDEIAMQLWRFEIASGKSTLLASIAPVDTVGVMGLKKGLVTPDAKHYVYSTNQRLDELYVIEGLR
ncbi:MAG: protein kinase [Myxococcales bacterium]|nr:protein kinase [Myxococcales bacterium]